ncbi:hypothetical protein FRC01_006336, partial [Tulasnella sp. 417]
DWPSRLGDKAGFSSHPGSQLSSKTKREEPYSSGPRSSESWDPEFNPSTMDAERRDVAWRKHSAVTIKIEESRSAEVGYGPSKAALPPPAPSTPRKACAVVEGTRTTSAHPTISRCAPNLRDASPKPLGGFHREVRSGHLGHRQTPLRSSGTVSSIPSGGAIHRTADRPNPVPTVTAEEATPKSRRMRSHQYVYRPPTSPRASETSIGAREGEDRGSASVRAETPVAVLPPLYPSSYRTSGAAITTRNTTPVHGPGYRRTTPQAFNVSPRPLVGKIKEARLPELRPALSSSLRTNRSGPLKREDSSVALPATQSAVHLPRGNDERNDGGEGYESSGSGDSDGSDRTIRPSRISSPSQCTGHNGTATNRLCSERTRPPITLPRRPQQPQLGLRYRTTQGSETEIRRRELWDRSNIPKSRQVDLSTRDIW